MNPSGRMPEARLAGLWVKHVKRGSTRPRDEFYDSSTDQTRVKQAARQSTGSERNMRVVKQCVYAVQRLYSGFK